MQFLIIYFDGSTNIVTASSLYEAAMADLSNEHSIVQIIKLTN